MHLSDSFVGLHVNFDLLVFGEFDDGDADLSVWVERRIHFDWHHGVDFLVDVGVLRHNVFGGDFDRVLCVVSDVDLVVLFALLALLVRHTIAFPGVVELRLLVGDKRYETETVREELVRQRGGVFVDVDHVDRHCRDLCQHDAAQGVCDGDVTIRQDKSDFLFVQFQNLEFGLLAVG